MEEALSRSLSTTHLGGSGYFRYPTMHGDKLAFVAEDDLWLVSSEGVRRPGLPRAKVFRCSYDLAVRSQADVLLQVVCPID